MRTVKAAEITERIRELCLEAATKLGGDVKQAIEGALKTEESPLGRDVLSQIVENYNIAENEEVPMCQDTGLAIFFIDVGRDVVIEGSTIDEAVNLGVRLAYEEGFLRKSVCDPLTRKNTGDNTPAIVHLKSVPGDKVSIKFAAKGGGSENMSAIAMLKPAQGIAGLKEFVVNTISTGGGNPCPPIIVGVGIGGDFEVSAILAKRALFRSVGSVNPDGELAALEGELLSEINALGVGPMGFGGTTTAIGVHIEKHPCHIASFPVAVNVQCHADRHKETVI